MMKASSDVSRIESVILRVKKDLVMGCSKIFVEGRIFMIKACDIVVASMPTLFTDFHLIQSISTASLLICGCVYVRNGASEGTMIIINDL